MSYHSQISPWTVKSGRNLPVTLVQTPRTSLLVCSHCLLLTSVIEIVSEESTSWVVKTTQFGKDSHNLGQTHISSPSCWFHHLDTILVPSIHFYMETFSTVSCWYCLYPEYPLLSLVPGKILLILQGSNSVSAFLWRLSRYPRLKYWFLSLAHSALDLNPCNMGFRNLEPHGIIFTFGVSAHAMIHRQFFRLSLSVQQPYLAIVDGNTGDPLGQ